MERRAFRTAGTVVGRDTGRSKRARYALLGTVSVPRARRGLEVPLPHAAPPPRRGARDTLRHVPTRSVPLPADDPTLATASLDELTLRWADVAARGAISAESMTRR